MANTPVTPVSISPSISISAAMTVKSATMGLKRMSPAITFVADDAYREPPVPKTATGPIHCPPDAPRLGGEVQAEARSQPAVLREIASVREPGGRQAVSAIAWKRAPP